MSRRKRMLEDLDQDIREHIEIETRENMERGMTPEEARYAALRKFGNTTRVQEEVREIWGWTWVERFGQDLRYGLRTLWRAKWISVAAVATLALGIGANTALFSVVYTVLLRSLPFPDSDRLMTVSQRDPHAGTSTDYFAPTTFFDWRSQNHSFASMSAVEDVRVTLAGRGEAVQLTGQAVSASFLDVLGVRPILGRNFRADEDLPNRNNVALISYALWQSRFGRSPSVIGQRITLDGFPFTVIGVLPPEFEFLSNLPSLWVTLGRDPNARWTEGRELRIVARLRPGASVVQAQTDLTALNRRLERDGPPILSGMGSEATLKPLIESYVGEIRPALLVLLGAALCVLLIACANVANLLLARATTRQREMAVRASLGVSRGRLIRQLLTESLVLTGIGGLLGVLVAWWSARFLIGLVPASMPIPASNNCTRISPSWHSRSASRLRRRFSWAWYRPFRRVRDVALSVRHGGRALGGGRRLRGSLVAIEIALAAVLLVAAGLLLRTFAYLRDVNPGFSARNVLACHLIVPEAQYRTGAQQAAFFARILERVRSLRGVRSAAAIDHLPVSGHGASSWIHVYGRPEPPPGQQLDALARSVTPGYFGTLGVPLYAGRDFTEADRGVLDILQFAGAAKSLWRRQP